MTGKRPDDFILPNDLPLLSKSLVSGLDESIATVRMRKKDGTIAWVEIKHRMVGCAATGEPTEIVIVIRDITERTTLEERLSVLELTDSRTGLFTHRAFDEALEREWNRTLREGSHVSLLLLDFDHFRQFHDAASGRGSLSGESCRCGDWSDAHNRFRRTLRSRRHCDHSSLHRLRWRSQSR